MPLPKKLLVIRLSAMGDVAMVVPVLIAFNRSYPDVEVVTLSRKQFKPLFSHLKNHTFLEAKIEEEHKGITGLYTLSKEVRSLGVDAVADFHNVLRSKVLRTYLSGLEKAKIDKGRKEKKQLVNDPEFFQPLKHTTQRYADVLQKLGFTVELEGDEQLPKQPMPSLDNNSMDTTGYQLVGLAPFAAHKTKALTINRAKKLVEQITQNKNIIVILIGGGKKEARRLQLVAGTTPHVINLAGTTTFEKELAVISNLDAMIAMDSGNGHLAALYGVPTITLWGNTHPYAGFAPYAQPQENQIVASRKKFPLIPTSIYGNKKVEGYRKATCSIKINKIIDRLEAILGNSHQ